MSIDTLGYVRALEKAGVERKIAEAHAEAFTANIAAELATKQDLKDAVADLRLEIWKVSIGIILATSTLTALISRFLH